MPNPPPLDVAELTAALKAAGLPADVVVIAAAAALPDRVALDLAGALLATAAYPETSREQLTTLLTSVTRFAAADTTQAVEAYFPTPAPPTPAPSPIPTPQPADQEMRTLIDYQNLFPKGNETVVSMSRSSPGPFPCPSGDIISPFGMFPAPIPGTKRAYRLKAVYFDEIADGQSHVQIGFNMFDSTTVLFDLPRVCSGAGASNFHFSNWYVPDTINTKYAHAFAQFVGGAVWENHAAVYSVVIEAHDLPMIDGLRLRDDGAGNIYLLLDGQMRRIPTPAIYQQLFRAEDYERRPEIAPYPVGADLAGSLTLAKGTPDGKMFFLVDNAKRCIPSWTIFNRYGFDPDKIQSLPADQLAAIADGADLA